MNTHPSTSRRNRARHPLAALALLLLFTGLSTVTLGALTTVPAAASHCPPVLGVVCTHDDQGDPSNPPNPPEPPGDNGSGGPGSEGSTDPPNDGDNGAVTTPFNVVRHIYFPGGRVPSCIGACGGASHTNDSVSARYRNRCDPPNGHPRWGAWDGVTIEYGGMYFLSGSQGGSIRVDYASYDCIPPAAWNDSRIACFHSYGARIRGPFNNPTVSSQTIRMPNSGRTLTNFTRHGGDAGPNDYRLCRESYSSYYEHTLTDFGQYEIFALGRTQNCTLRTYRRIDSRTRNTPRPDIVDCGAPVRYERNRMEAQLFCSAPYFEQRWTNTHSFTITECLNETSGEFSCGPEINRTGRYAGFNSRNFDAFDDGRPRLLSWRTINPGAQPDIRRVRNRESRLWWREGTPYRENKGPAHDDQPFVTDPAIEGWVGNWRAAAAGRRTGWNTQFFAASDPNARWTVRPQWKFDAQFRIRVVTITDIDFESGTVTWRDDPQWEDMDDAVCTGTPARLNVHRARNDTVH